MATISLGTTSFSGVTLSPSSTSSTTQTTTTTKTPEAQFKELQQQFIKGDISGEEFATKAKALGYNVTVNTNAIQLPKVADLQAQRAELVRLLNIAKKNNNYAMGQKYNETIDQIDQMISIINSKATTASKQAQIAKVIGFDGTPIPPCDILEEALNELDNLIKFTANSACSSSPATKSRVKGYLTNLKNEYETALNKVRAGSLSESELESLFKSLETKTNSIFNNSMVKDVVNKMPDKIASGEFEPTQTRAKKMGAGFWLGVASVGVAFVFMIAAPCIATGAAFLVAEHVLILDMAADAIANTKK